MIFLFYRKVPLFFWIVISILPLLLCSCSNRSEKWKPSGKTVEIVKIGEDFQLLRNGEPYFIKGAGAYSNFELLKEAGANSIRVWDTNDAGRILDQAQELGMTVNLGIWLTREKEGFDYDDNRAVEKQFEHVKREVLKYKDHPALLMWTIGNEMNAGATNVRVWDAVNEIAKMIHKVDPNHPVSTSLMDVPFRAIRIIKDRCPHLDILSINTYGGLSNLAEQVEQSAWDGPYIISEFGALGYWEVPLTEWDAPLEQNSSQKARFFKEKYEKYILKEKDKCLGSYAFFWGHKQEKTHTWFSLFSLKGEKTEAVDMLQYLWSGSLPENQAPKIETLSTNYGLDIENLIVSPGNIYTAEIIAHDPEGDSLRYEWEILPEIEVRDGAVDRLRKPNPIPGSVVSSNGASIQWKAPNEKGPYRLFVNVRDGHNNIATANFPFHVGPTETATRLANQEEEASKKGFFKQLLNYFPK